MSEPLADWVKEGYDELVAELTPVRHAVLFDKAYCWVRRRGRLHLKRDYW